MVDFIRPRVLSLLALILVVYIIFNALPSYSQKPHSHIPAQIDSINYSGYFMAYIPNQENYIGTWRSTESSLLENRSGRAYLASKLTKSKINNFFIRILFFDGFWESDPAYALSLEYGLEKLIHPSLKWSGLMNLITKEHGTISRCNGTALINYDSSLMKGTISGGDCKINLNLEMKEFSADMEKDPKIYYCIFISGICMVLILIFAKHLHLCLLNSNYAQKTSIISLGMNASLDCFLSFWHIDRGFRTWLGFDYMLISSLWNFGVFFIVEGKLALAVWTAQHPELNHYGYDMSRRMSSNFHARFCLIVVAVVVVLIAASGLSKITVPLMHCIFVPQIISNALNGYKDSLSPCVYITILLTRLTFSAYIFVYPNNFMNYEPQPILFGFIAFICLAQFVILTIQRAKPDFIIPDRFRPKVHDYFTEAKKIRYHFLGNECIICMNCLNTEDSCGKTRTMYAPCGHRFHEECLINWMNIKMECPTCRNALPTVP